MPPDIRVVMLGGEPTIEKIGDGLWLINTGNAVYLAASINQEERQK